MRKTEDITSRHKVVARYSNRVCCSAYISRQLLHQQSYGVRVFRRSRLLSIRQAVATKTVRALLQVQRVVETKTFWSLKDLLSKVQHEEKSIKQSCLKDIQFLEYNPTYENRRWAKKTAGHGKRVALPIRKPFDNSVEQGSCIRGTNTAVVVLR